MQTAAHQKYARTNPVMMNAYLVGHRLNSNQATFKESVQAIITKLGTDTLSSITSAKVANMQTLLTANATTQRKQRDAQVTSITDRRITIQFAPMPNGPTPWTPTLASMANFSCPPATHFMVKRTFEEIK